MMLSGMPMHILKDSTKRFSGKEAMLNNLDASIAVADAIRSTLGPRGMDKMLINSTGEIVITNDGITILKEMELEHPAAKMMVEVAKAVNLECGDGTTTSVVLTGELLKRARDMLDAGIHPSTITHGYTLAGMYAIRKLEEIAVPFSINDIDILKKLAFAAITGKSVSHYRDKFASIVVDAIMAVRENLGPSKVRIDLSNIRIEKIPGGGVGDTELIEGIVLNKSRTHKGMPTVIEKAKIALISRAIEVKKPEIDTEIKIMNKEMFNLFIAEEERIIREMTERLKGLGINAVFCKKSISDLAKHYLSKYGIFALEKVDKKSLEQLKRATGARIVNSPKELSPGDIGICGRIEERKIGDDTLTFIIQCKNPKAVSILIRGGTEHIINEVERQILNALNVLSSALRDTRYIAGGGATAVALAHYLRKYATTISGREQIVVEAYADALEGIVKALAENSGHNPIDTVIELRRYHAEGRHTFGIDADTGKHIDMLENAIIEPLRIGRQVIVSATDAAVMLLRIDDIIAATSKR